MKEFYTLSLQTRTLFISMPNSVTQRHHSALPSSGKLFTTTHLCAKHLICILPLIANHCKTERFDSRAVLGDFLLFVEGALQRARMLASNDRT